MESFNISVQVKTKIKRKLPPYMVELLSLASLSTRNTVSRVYEGKKKEKSFEFEEKSLVVWNVLRLKYASSAPNTIANFSKKDPKYTFKNFNHNILQDLLFFFF